MEILGIRSVDLRSGATRHTGLFFFELPETVVNGFYVVPTPTTRETLIEGGIVIRSTLPEEVDDFDLLTQDEKGRLDRGELAFESWSLTQQPSESNASVLARARDIYSGRKTAFIDRLTTRIQFTGVRRDML